MKRFIAVLMIVASPLVQAQRAYPTLTPLVPLTDENGNPIAQANEDRARRAISITQINSQTESSGKIQLVRLNSQYNEFLKSREADNHPSGVQVLSSQDKNCGPLILHAYERNVEKYLAVTKIDIRNIDIGLKSLRSWSFGAGPLAVASGVTNSSPEPKLSGIQIPIYFDSFIEGQIIFLPWTQHTNFTLNQAGILIVNNLRTTKTGETSATYQIEMTDVQYSQVFIERIADLSTVNIAGYLNEYNLRQFSLQVVAARLEKMIEQSPELKQDIQKILIFAALVKPSGIK